MTLGNSRRKSRPRSFAATIQLAELFDEDHPGVAGPAAEFPLEHYEEIVEWAGKPWAAVITIRRPGFRPGRFTIRLDTATAPLTAWHFSRRVESGFYDGIPFRRLVPNLAIQYGDVDLLSEPVWDPPIRDEVAASPWSAGTMGMVSSGRDSAGSEWFVVLTPQPQYTGRFTPFAEVVQNFPGVIALVLPDDRVESIRIYEGDGTEPLPPL